ncbi:sulfur carrier protein ThiS adenylyltransferase ThiF [Candidatus Dependentiae bacterium]|nr:sulfur carrier protein ThiS adenylyltransferase ThiF [Candidatus Dependentiae bacterium]
MNFFEKSLKNYYSEQDIIKLKKFKVGIAGAGGLGSNCAFNLVRSGITKLVICDFDIVEEKNLNRQFYFFDQIGKSKVEMLKMNLLKINPDIEITAVEIKLEENNIEKIFQDCQIIAEAVDKAELKKMIVEKFILTNKFIVSASGLAGIGKSDEISIHKIKPNFYLIGDLVSQVCETLPPFSPKVNIAAAKQADTILEFILSK